VAESHQPHADKMIAIRKLKRSLLEGAVKSNLGGVENAVLYSKTYHGTKQAIEDYVQEGIIFWRRLIYRTSVCASLETLAKTPMLTVEEKRRIFVRASKMYGRSALCLSGGATFGYFHFGVIKALLEHNRLPQVITGTSAGSLVAAFTCVRTDAELMRDINSDLYQYLTGCALLFDWLM
jgi:hypothetical protein